MVAPVTSIADSEAYRRPIVDEFDCLSRAKQARLPDERRLDVLTLEIRSWYVDLPADQTAIAPGTNCDVQIGQKAVEKSWKSMAVVYKAAGGMKPFLKLCTVTFKALSDSIGNSAAEALQQEDRTGYRKLKAVARLSPAVELPKAA